ncbi:hypothetical protein O0L34_g6786 [Tuta absoluta]|nr:hypothetical protein O0L34_g6786 [Tuta absoluta]
MYLAIKWLIFLGLVMWTLLCYMDIHLNRIYHRDTPQKPTTPHTNFNEKFSYGNNQRPNMAFLNYLTFIAGALAVTIFNKKSEIYIYARKTIIKMNIRANLKIYLMYFKKTATTSWITTRTLIIPCWEQTWEKIKKCKLAISFSKIRFQIPFLNENEPDEQRKDRNLLLLKRLREVGLERNRLGQLLVVAVKENKNMRLRHHLENMAKKRLMQQIQETQEQIKESRSQYLNFQQIHLMTSQENLYLKNRIKKIIKDKEEADANLMKLVNKVFKSTDNNLKAYCANFMVKTKENMFVSDAQADISSIFQCLRQSTSKPKRRSDEDKDSQTLPSTSSSAKAQETIFTVASDSPRLKLKSQPGEYVWTIKDKEGKIEKLYEYDYGFNFDNGDAIRRIREYSVYHESDCLLDLDVAK